MRRIAITAGVALAALFAVVAGAASASTIARTTPVSPAPPATPVRAQLSRLTCHQALDPTRRTVSVQAVMRPVTATRAMQLQFVLTARPPTTVTPAPVAGSGLNAWLSPADPTLGQQPADVWKLNKTVSDVAPGRYTFLVSFRWLGPQGTVLATSTLPSDVCSIREIRPDVLVRSIGVRALPRHARRDRYVAVIANRGPTGAGPFEVLFDPGPAGLASRTRMVHWLAPGAVATETFTGPVCDAARPPAVVADATGSVDDADRSNNAMTATCPTRPTAVKRDSAVLESRGP